MDEVIRNMSGGQLIGFTAVVLGVLFVTVSSLASTIGSHWRKVRQTEAETQLKRDLVAAGFTADEIERVVRATTDTRRVGKPECGHRSAARRESAA